MTLVICIKGKKISTNHKKHSSALFYFSNVIKTLLRVFDPYTCITFYPCCKCSTFLCTRTYCNAFRSSFYRDGKKRHRDYEECSALKLKTIHKCLFSAPIKDRAQCYTSYYCMLCFILHIGFCTPPKPPTRWWTGSI